MKVYEIIGEDKKSYGLFLHKERAKITKLELDQNAKKRGLNIYYNIHEIYVIE